MLSKSNVQSPAFIRKSSGSSKVGHGTSNVETTLNEIVHNNQARTYNPNVNGCIVFVFDDGNRDSFNNGVPIFNAAGVPANAALSVQRLLNREPWDATVASRADWLKVQNEHGWEISAHGHSESVIFNSALDLETGESELKTQFDLLNERGFKVKTFTAPSSVLDAKFLPACKKYFSAAFIGANTSNPTITDNNGNDAYNIKRVSLEENLTTEALFNAFVDYIETNKTMGVVYLHKVDGGFGTVPVTTARLTNHLAYVATKNVDVLTLSDALQRFNTNTLRKTYLGGEDKKVHNFFDIGENLLKNAAFNNSSSWVFGTGTVGATSTVESATVVGKHVFGIGAGAGSGTTQISQSIKLPTSKSPLPISVSCVFGVDSGALSGQDIIIDLIYKKAGATVGTKSITRQLTTAFSPYELNDSIIAGTQADELSVVYKVANNTPGVAVDVAMLMPYVGFGKTNWNAPDNKPMLRCNQSVVQAAIATGGATIIYNNVLVDRLGEYNNATGVFTCKRNGDLKINASINIGDMGFGYTGTELKLEIRKNGATVLKNRTSLSDGNRFNRMANISGSVECVVGDTISILLSHNNGSSVTLQNSPDSNWLTVAI